MTLGSMTLQQIDHWSLNGKASDGTPYGYDLHKDYATTLDGGNSGSALAAIFDGVDSLDPNSFDGGASSRTETTFYDGADSASIVSITYDGGSSI